MKGYLTFFLAALAIVFAVVSTLPSITDELYLNWVYRSLANTLVPTKSPSPDLLTRTEQLLVKADGKLQATAGLGLLAYSSNDYENAIIHWQEALNLNPENSVIAYYLGAAQLASGQSDNAMQSWNRAKAELRFTAEGDHYLEEKDLLTAREKYRIALDINPNWIPAKEGLDKVLHNLYWRLHSEGKIDRAIIYLQEAVEVSPKEQDYLILGDHARDLGRFDEALYWYERGLLQFPNEAKFNQRLGWLALNAEDFDSAESYFQISITHDPESANTHRLLGMALFKQGRYREAEQELQRSLTLNPNSAWGFMQLGDVYLAMDQLDAAIDAYENAILLDPTNSRAIQQLRLLNQDSQ
jgi:tetratricopeptide (TPR) repeat protein